MRAPKETPLHVCWSMLRAAVSSAGRHHLHGHQLLDITHSPRQPPKGMYLPHQPKRGLGSLSATLGGETTTCKRTGSIVQAEGGYAE